jgi:hypothetical protein
MQKRRPLSCKFDISLRQAMSTTRTTVRRKLNRDASNDASNFDDYLMLAAGVALVVMLVLA